jgi:trimethylamine---corrinoid protein Co-methyltransferase
MALKGYKRKFRPLEILSGEEVEAIHAASIDILKETGVKFESKWALDFLEKNDCIVDRDRSVVRFPEGLVEESVRRAPSVYRVKAREEKYDEVYCKDTVYFQDAPAMNTIDLDDYSTRTPTKSEYIDYVKVLDALDTVHNLSSYPYFGVSGVPPIMAMPELMAIKFKYTSKFHQSPYAEDNEIFSIKMAKAVGMEIMGNISQAAPLTWFDSAVSSARRFIEAGFPVVQCSGSTFGATAPATIAGAVAKTNAEHMSMIVMVQLINPGHRILLWDLDFPQNTRTGAPAFGQIGTSIGCSMFNQMWRHYGIPVGNATVGFVNSKIPDFQGAYERTIGTLTSALTGCSLIQLHGCVMGELSGHPVQAVLDDDIAGMVGRFIQGEQVNDDTLAVDLIREVGQIPGHYLGKKHTLDWWRKEQFIPSAADRTSSYSDWYKGGKKTCLDLAKERVKNILKTHQPLVLDEEKSGKIDKILEEARQYYKKRDML